MAQDEIDEDALFGDTAIMVDVEDLAGEDNMADEQKGKSISFSGRVISSAAGYLDRRWFESASDDTGWFETKKEYGFFDHTRFNGTVIGIFEGDFRLPHSVKSFITTEAMYNGTNDSVQFSLNELFLDWNAGQRIYFRAGKQVLQWGRGYFFNPVDLVNIEKSRFFDELGGREGAYGLKFHIPFQTRANIYGFLDMGQVSRVDSLALSLKTEFLVKATEFAFSVWGKNNYDPVYGFDISTRLGTFSITGEVALYQTIGKFSKIIFDKQSPNIFPVIDTVHWAPRVSLGIGRYFDLGNINDRVMVAIEGYYNHIGNETGSFKALFPSELDFSSFQNNGALFENEMTTLLASGMLEMNNFSKWYTAAFITINRFILTDMTLSSNVLFNVNQRCAMATAGLNYTTLHNLSFDFIISGFPGKDLTEYTLMNQGLNVEARAGIRF